MMKLYCIVWISPRHFTDAYYRVTLVISRIGFLLRMGQNVIYFFIRLSLLLVLCANNSHIYIDHIQREYHEYQSGYLFISATSVSSYIYILSVIVRVTGASNLWGGVSQAPRNFFPSKNMETYLYFSP